MRQCCLRTHQRSSTLGKTNYSVIEMAGISRSEKVGVNLNTRVYVCCICSYIASEHIMRRRTAETSLSLNVNCENIFVFISQKANL